jgi:hypothetical protein
MPGDPNPYAAHVVQAYLDLRYDGIPQGDAAREAGVPQPRAAVWDRQFSLPTSVHPDRRPLEHPDWKAITATCPGCGRVFEKVDAGQRFCPDSRHRCAQNARRRLARSDRGAA